MSTISNLPHYSATEESINIASHALGLVLSIAALIALLMRASSMDSILAVVSFGIFGFSLIVLYAISTIYHGSKDLARRRRLRIADHASIYVLIAGTYTPFTLLTLEGRIGWSIFAVSWGMALAGIVLKLFFTGKYRLLSTLLYVFMGWIIIFAINPLIERFPGAGLVWLVAGGVAYTVGAALYSIAKMPFNHAVFHLFVLIGSGCHFVAVYFYIV